jgi:peptidoglycan/LPS O-acetylase OafA/YrhL
LPVVGPGRLPIATEGPVASEGSVADGESPRPEEPAAKLDPLLQGHLPALDGVRGLAILLVTLYRFNTPPGTDDWLGNAWYSLMKVGANGVDLFFVLSGFLITGILHDGKARPRYFRDFYIRRSLRIFPLYYGVLFAAFVVVPAFFPQAVAAYQFSYDRQAWFWLYGANLLQCFEGDWRLGPFDHFWSLSVEEHFYFAWPLVIYTCRRETAMRVCGWVIAASIAARAMWLLAGGSDVAAHVFTLFRADALVFGGWIALAARGPGGVASLLSLARWLAMGGTVLFLADLFLPGRFLELPKVIYSALSGSALIFAVGGADCRSTLSQQWQRLCCSMPLRFLGKYSYGIYVYQALLIPILAPILTAERAVEWVGHDFAGRLVYMAAMFAVTTILAMASWRLFEEPFVKAKRWLT